MFVIIKDIFGIVQGFFALRRAQQAAAIQSHNRIAAQQMAGTLTDNTLQLAQLYSFRNANFLRTTDFFVLLMPYVVCIFSPHEVAHYFQNVAIAIPPWFQYVTVGAFYAIWGMGKHIEYKGRVS